MKVSKGSYIEFYKNGEKQKNRFEEIQEANYFAAVSLYMNAKVEVNFGQAPFKFAPEGVQGYNNLCKPISF
jgi:hypothetical protein